MARKYVFTSFASDPNLARTGSVAGLLLLLILLIPSAAFGQGGATEAINTTCGFASDIKSILNAISIIVVTIAVIFSGYQIAFAHKRIGDVAPVLIGAILIGAASQISTMFLKSSSTSGGGSTCPGASTLSHFFDHYAVVVQLLNHYA